METQERLGRLEDKSAMVAVDTGGTFSDLLAVDPDGVLTIAKTLSTPSDPSRGIFDAIKKGGLDPGAISHFVHGTTVGTNMLIERAGSRVGLLTTRGFRDLLRIQRIDRPESFDLHWIKPRHLVERAMSLEVRERTGAHGEVVEALSEEDVATAVARLKAEGVPAIAVCYMFSFLNSDHERRTRELIHELYPEAYVSISSEVFPQWREYERSSTTVIDVYLKPRIDRYLTNLETELREAGAGAPLIMRSNGGVMTTANAREQPVTMIRSGPAGGVIASLEVGTLLGIDSIMTADIGGTSFDACLIADRRPAMTSSTELEFGIPIATPMLDIRSIGAGGGSEAWIDSGGILKVGPRSAGAEPGPACYGRGGTVATSTDANVVLGRLDPDFKLGGEVQLVEEAARKAVQAVSDQLDMGLEETASGILEIMNSSMAETMRLLTVDQGLDPREFSLIAFGGAGPLHGAYLAEALGMTRVIVPVYPGVFSAAGCLMADTRFDYMKSRITHEDNVDLAIVAADFEELEARAISDFEREGFAESPLLMRSIDIRYSGQNWELEASLPAGQITAESIAEVRRAFDKEHERQFGWFFPESNFELVNFRVVAARTRATVDLPAITTGPAPDPVKTGSIYFDETSGRVDTLIYRRSDLHAENEITGPAIVVEDVSTTLVPPNWTARVEGHGHIIMETSQNGN